MPRAYSETNSQRFCYAKSINKNVSFYEIVYVKNQTPQISCNNFSCKNASKCKYRNNGTGIDFLLPENSEKG